jgi:hypothetical protein
MLYTADKQQRPVNPTEKLRPASKSEAEAELKDLASNISDDAESAAKETIELLSGYAQVCVQVIIVISFSRIMPDFVICHLEVFP